MLLTDLHQEKAAAQTLTDAKFKVATATVDVASRNSVQALVEPATSRGEATGLLHAAGVSPSPATLLRINRSGTALVLKACRKVIAHGGAGVVIASQSGHCLLALTPAQDNARATTPVEELPSLPLVQPD